MSLDAYCSEKRPVIMSPSASAYEAARALEDNHIGAIVVQEHGRVIGIVTDRDLVLRVLGFRVDPKETPLSEVMTEAPATVSLEANEEDAIQLMRAWHVRRIPVTDGERAVGIVTLDDLLLLRAIDADQAAEIIEDQLAEPASSKPFGLMHPTRLAKGSLGGPARIEPEARRATRAEQTMRAFVARLQSDLSIADAQRALTALRVVASAIVRRLTSQEAQDLASQLPSVLREELLDLPAGPDLGVTRASIETELAARLDIEREEAAALAPRVGAALATYVSAGEIRDVLSQLPRDLTDLLAPPA